MRHFFGFVLGVILVPVLAYAPGWGFARATASGLDPATGTLRQSDDLYVAFAVMLGTGLLIGLVLVAKAVSPLAGLLPGAALLGWTGYFLADARQAVDLTADLPLTGQVDSGMQTLLQTGVFALLGLALLVPIVAPTRWRSEDEDEEYI